MASVLLNSVTKTFPGNIKALAGISLNIAEGEFMAIVGPSGCGKTTTLRVIAGLEKPSSGTICIADRLVNDVAPNDRGVAMVFQNYALYPHMTVFQNMAFGLKLRRISKSEIGRRVEEAAVLLGIGNLLERKPLSLSGGQRQRVALGRAIVQRPRVFLFDEPLSNLDPQTRASARRELKSLHKRLQATTVYVTHDQVEAMTLGDRVTVMNEGVIHQVGSPREVFDNPADRFVAGFFGTPPMNFLEGTLRINGRGSAFVTCGAEIALPEDMAGRLTASDGEELVLGIRPKDLQCGPVDPSAIPGLLGTIDAIEIPGDRVDAYLTTDSGLNLVASVATQSEFKVGDLVRIAVGSSRISVFEKGLFGKSVGDVGPAARRG